jgi:hypothetical protein
LKIISFPREKNRNSSVHSGSGLAGIFHCPLEQMWKAVLASSRQAKKSEIEKERDVPGSCAGIVGLGSNEGSGAGCCPTLQSARI